MKRYSKIHSNFVKSEGQLHHIISNYESEGTPFGNQKRNSLKLFKLNNDTVNVKSFRVPNIFNQVAYKFFRRSKAQRSFEYATRLLDLEVNTPQPIAYYEYSTRLLFKKSYYISKQLENDLTYRELTKDLDYPDHEIILRAFTRFTFDLHEKGINFLDHSPGNTLITKVDGQYEFALVDLNRMEFKQMDFKSRVKNLSRLTKKDELVSVMSDEYAKLYGVSYNEMYTNLWDDINTFQSRRTRKQEIKKRLLFR